MLKKASFPPSSGLNDKLDCDAIGDDVEIIAPLPLKLNNQQCTYKDCFMMLAQVYIHNLSFIFSVIIFFLSKIENHPR